MQTQVDRRENQWRGTRARNGSARMLANGLGWFSIGLGVAELVAPRAVAKFIGVNEKSRTQNLLRFYGAREIAAGIGILSQANPSGWLWARVGGDFMDLSSLGRAMTSRRTERGRAGAATAAVLGVTALDIVCAQQLTRASGPNGTAIQEPHPQITQSIIIERSPEEIYNFWRDCSRLQKLSRRLQSVEAIDHKRSHWTVNGPLGHTLEWDAEITEDERNERIAWRSSSATAPHSGSVRFERATGGRGTKVTVQFHLAGIGGFGRLLGLVPEQQIASALHNLKQLLETGEILDSDASLYTGMHPAQPSQEHGMPPRSMRASASA